MIKKFIKKEPVLVFAWTAAVISGFAVPLNKNYIDYIDFRTLGLLFCLMCVTGGLKKLGVFRMAGEKLLLMVKNSMQLELILVMLCFFSSMLLTNDVALITFVPFAIEILDMAGLSKKLVFVVSMQTVAANLGSMLTPIGNPQNIYIYTKYGVSAAEFFCSVFPYSAVSFIFISAVIIFQKNKSSININLNFSEEKIDIKKFVLYIMLFLLAVLSVGRIIPIKIIFWLFVVLFSIVDREILKTIDYNLLFTFVGFFVFIGNMGKIEIFRSFIKSVIAGNEIITSVISSQFLSNVPSALLLSGFKDNWKGLLIGVNIGGLGTLIASMASLISYKFFVNTRPKEKGGYIKFFTFINLIMLIILLAVSKM